MKENNLLFPLKGSETDTARKVVVFLKGYFLRKILNNFVQSTW